MDAGGRVGKAVGGRWPGYGTKGDGGERGLMNDFGLFCGWPGWAALGGPSGGRSEGVGFEGAIYS